MLNALIVVYRESFEALLIVGLLYSFLVRRHSGHRAFRALGAGTLAGIALAGLLGFFIHIAESDLEGLALDVFQMVMMAVAVVLMAHMCIWMRKHARTLKKELETDAELALSTGNYLSLATLTAIAVGREGSETVIFLYGLLVEAIEKSQVGSFFAMAAGGLVLGIATWFVFQKGFQLFSQRAYFTVSSILLFLTGGSLLLSVSRKLIELDWLPVGREQIWDTSWLLDDSSWTGNLVSLITGYHARPAVASVLLYVLYWVITLWLYSRAGQVQSLQAKPVVAAR